MYLSGQHNWLILVFKKYLRVKNDFNKKIIEQLFQVLIPLALLAIAEAGFLQAPLQQVQFETPLALEHAGAPAFHSAAPLAHAVPQYAAQQYAAPQYAAPLAHAVPQYAQAYHAVPAPTAQVVGLQQTLVKQVAVPYPVDKYVKVDRQIPYPVDKYVKVDRPYEVIKYVQEPYYVKVQRPVHVEIIKKIEVPQPIVQVEPILPEPQHIRIESPVAHEVHHAEASLPISAPLPLPAPAPQSSYLPPSH